MDKPVDGQTWSKILNRGLSPVRKSGLSDGDLRVVALEARPFQSQYFSI
jgi:hypothetical protein